MNKTVYIDLDEITHFHNEIIACSSGSLGLRDVDLLQSILVAIQNDLYYPSLFSKLNHLVFSINKNHCFVDGNKRTSIISGALFLLKNGYSIGFVRQFILVMETVAVWIAQNQPSKDDLKLLIESLFIYLEDGVDSDICCLIDEIRTCLYEIEQNILTRIKTIQDAFEEGKTSNLSQIDLSNRKLLELERLLRIVKSDQSMMEILAKIFSYYNVLKIISYIFSNKRQLKSWLF